MKEPTRLLRSKEERLHKKDISNDLMSFERKRLDEKPRLSPNSQTLSRSFQIVMRVLNIRAIRLREYRV